MSSTLPPKQSPEIFVELYPQPQSPSGIDAIEYEPPLLSTANRTASKRQRLLFFLPIAVLLGCLLFVLFARSVFINVIPSAAKIEIIEGWPRIPLAGRYLMLPGRYSVLVSAEGYHPSRQEIIVRGTSNQQFDIALNKLDGRLSVKANVTAAVLIDGELVGQTPLAEVALSPGQHELVLRASGYQKYSQTLMIEGRNVLQSFALDLLPSSASLTLETSPSDATIFVDGEEVGTTPAELSFEPGAALLRITKRGFEDWKQSYDFKKGDRLSPQVITLVPAAPSFTLNTIPTAANVTLAGKYLGITPLEIEWPARGPLKLSKAGYVDWQQDISDQPADSEKVVELVAAVAMVRFDIKPVDADVRLDGEVIDTAKPRHQLQVKKYQLSASMDGFVEATKSFVPRADKEQTVTLQLKTIAEARAERFPATIKTKDNVELVYVTTGSFSMGSPRREQGRRANEVLRKTTITRDFYIATTETTNAQYRMFDSKHHSGHFSGQSLNGDELPVVALTWQDAARYCNWLSERESLPKAYRSVGNFLELKEPYNEGYRLPSEAEWVWAAAKNTGKRQGKYAWGEKMPPPAFFANVADQSAVNVLRSVLPDYNDSFIGPAPVKTFPPDNLGLFDSVGNVSEWVNDVYVDRWPANPVATDPMGPAKGKSRVVRGSSWMHNSINQLRMAYREQSMTARRDLGFRIARFVEAENSE